ncbi:hypothetical protein D9M71_503880 [compost metagenome]
MDGQLAADRRLTGGGSEQRSGEVVLLQGEMALRHDWHQLAGSQARDREWAMFEAVGDHQGLGRLAFGAGDGHLIARIAGEQATLHAEQGYRHAQLRGIALEDGVGFVDATGDFLLDAGAGVPGAGDGNADDSQGDGDGQGGLLHSEILSRAGRNRHPAGAGLK